MNLPTRYAQSFSARGNRTDGDRRAVVGSPPRQSSTANCGSAPQRAIGVWIALWPAVPRIKSRAECRVFVRASCGAPWSRTPEQAEDDW